jgi:hypothetical protein
MAAFKNFQQSAHPPKIFFIIQNRTQNKINVKVRKSVPTTVKMNIAVNETADCRLTGAVILLPLDVRCTSNRSKC